MKWFTLALFFLGLIAISLAENSSEAAPAKPKEDHPKAVAKEVKEVKKEVKTIENSSEVHEEKKEKPVKKEEKKEAAATSTTAAPATATTAAPKEEKGLFGQVVDSVVGAVQSVRDHVKSFFGFGSSDKATSASSTVAPTAAAETTKKP